MRPPLFMRILGGAAVLAATPALPGCSSALPAEALAAWQPPAPVPPGRCAAGCWRTPSWRRILHNLQSWLVDLHTPGEIWLYCDHAPAARDRPARAPDPHEPGHLPELLHLAALQQGLRAEVDLFHGVFDPATPPAPPRTHHATARVRLVPDASARPDPLFGQIFTATPTARPTNRAPPRGAGSAGHRGGLRGARPARGFACRAMHACRSTAPSPAMPGAWSWSRRAPCSNR